MQLARLDDVELFSLTMWKSAKGVTVGVQKFAGDPVRYATRGRVSGVIEALLPGLDALPALPY